MNTKLQTLFAGTVNQGSNSTGSASDQFAAQMEKRIAEVEMGFLHLQQNIEIPEISIQINPLVLQAIQRCAEEGRKPRLDDFTDRVQDTNFLNALHSGVTRWIREIKKVLAFVHWQGPEKNTKKSRSY